MKSKATSTIKKILFLLLFALIYLGLAYGIGVVISQKYGYKLENILTYEGILLIFIGILTSMRGNPSGVNLNNMGRGNANISSYLNNEITRQEREMKPYHKDFYKNNIVKFAFGRLTFIVGGLLILALVYLFLI